eukprot:s189_g5.t1
MAAMVNLVMNGVSGIEDRLQDEVSDTIIKMTQAGIKVWMLTGDKTETAINIGVATGLLAAEAKPGDRPMFSSGDFEKGGQFQPADMQAKLHEVAEQARHAFAQKQMLEGMVIDGKCLELALEPQNEKDFVAICRTCTTVICCRVSPKQKGAVVRLIKQEEKAITLAIGDGANDCNMIMPAFKGGIPGESQQRCSALGLFLVLRRIFPSVGAGPMGAAGDVRRLVGTYWPLLLGNVLEWYEFCLFSFLEPYFEKNFFRGSAVEAWPFEREAAAWLGFAITFLGRPFGGLVLGLLGDLFGRKVSTFLSIFGMLLGTVGQGLVPSFKNGEALGYLGIILLVLLRVVQGISTGGEIAAVPTYLTEVGAKKSLACCIVLIPATSHVGHFLALLVSFAFEESLGEETRANSKESSSKGSLGVRDEFGGLILEE